MDQRLQLIITADDFGYSSQRNLAITELFAERKISRTTLLMNGKFTAHALRLADQCCIPVGLHFNLTEGKPICASVDVESLIDTETGLFYGKHGFRERLKLGLISPQHIEREFKAQIQLYTNNFTKSPPFIDGHQHVHVIPEVAQVIAPHFPRIGTFQTRIPLEELSQCHWIKPRARMEFYDQVCKDSALAMKIYMAHKISYPSAFVGLSMMGREMTLQNAELAFEKVINGSHGSISCEFMTHPGYTIPPFIGGCFGAEEDDFSSSCDRTHELSFLRSKSFAKLMEQYQIHLLHSTSTNSMDCLSRF